MELQNYHHFLQNLALILGAAAISLILFQKLKQPIILGYILTGIIIGPHTPIPLFANTDIVHLFSELGVILLMFSLGLEFSIRKLIRVFPSAGLIALLQCSFMIWIGYLSGQLFGWTRLESVYAGAIIAISSTTIILKAFAEQGVTGKLTQIVFGVLIVEDLVAILLLAILTPLSTGANLSAEKVVEIFGTLGAFLVGLLVIGMFLIPRFIRFVVRFNRPEVTLVVSVGLCFAIAWIAKESGYSVALGAFLAGSLIAESGEEKQIEQMIQPVRDIFGAIFFVSVGMLFDPSAVVQYWFPILVFTLLVIFGKIIGVSLGAFLTGYSPRLSIKTGMSLAQIGEFSFIIASVGIASGGTRDFLYAIAVTISVITTLITPWLIRLSNPLAHFVDEHLPQSIQTFTSLYGSWIQKLRETKPGVKKPSRAFLKWLMIDSILLIALIIGSSLLKNKIIIFITSHIDLPSSLLSILFISLVTLFAIPFCIGIVRSGKRLGLILASEVIPSVEPGRLDLAAAPRRAFVVTLQLIIISLVGLILLAVTQPFLPIFYSGIVFGIGLILLAISFWKGAENLQGHMKAGVQVILEALTPKNHLDETTSFHLINQFLPGIENVTPVKLEAGSPVIGKTLSQIDLRGMTEASVMAILKKGEKGILVPTGRELLELNDVLALVGTEEAIEASKKLLLGK